MGPLSSEIATDIYTVQRLGPPAERAATLLTELGDRRVAGSRSHQTATKDRRPAGGPGWRELKQPGIGASYPAFRGIENIADVRFAPLIGKRATDGRSC